MPAQLSNASRSIVLDLPAELLWVPMRMPFYIEGNGNRVVGERMFDESYSTALYIGALYVRDGKLAPSDRCVRLAVCAKPGVPFPVVPGDEVSRGVGDGEFVFDAFVYCHSC